MGSMKVMSSSKANENLSIVGSFLWLKQVDWEPFLHGEVLGSSLEGLGMQLMTTSGRGPEGAPLKPPRGTWACSLGGAPETLGCGFKAPSESRRKGIKDVSIELLDVLYS